MVVDVLAAAGGIGSGVALLSPTRSWTYRELDLAVSRTADELRTSGTGGTGGGEVAPVVLDTDADGIIALLAHWRLGVVPAPLNPRLTESEVRAASAALTEAPRGTQAVVWTSGTAGRPRGVALSFDNLEASARAAEERLGLRADEVWLASLSSAHVGGLALITRSLLLGGTLVAPGGFDTAVVNDLLDGRGLPDGTRMPVTQMSLVPTQLLRLLDHRRGASPPATFRCALIGGAHAPAELVARAHRADWPLALTYGATEMCSQIATAGPDLARKKPGTVGKPLRGVELRIAEDEELLVRGPTRALGYVGSDPERSATADADGWYHTGDLGRLDDAGDLWITGRRRDRLVSGGVTVDAVEVEEALRGHPAVIDACVVGLPDEEWGEKVAAWVEPVIGQFDQDEVDDHLRTILSVAKLPRVWYYGPELPRNPNGKVDRGRVLEVLSGR